MHAAQLFAGVCLGGSVGEALESVGFDDLCAIYAQIVLKILRGVRTITSTAPICIP